MVNIQRNVGNKILLIKEPLSHYKTDKQRIQLDAKEQRKIFLKMK